jgi:succinyl-CoA synthetase alpha subunit
MLLDRDTQILVQGITGREASAMAEDMLAYGTHIVAGVTPGKGGQSVHGVPVYDTVAEAQQNHSCNASIISVPAPGVLDAAAEAIAHGIKLLVIMTERVPRLDTARLLWLARTADCAVIGPNTLGLIRPGVAKMGTIGGRVDNVHRSFKPGRVAILSRSGGMTTEIASFLTSHGIGQSVAIGVGGDPIIGADFCNLLDSLEADQSTEALVIYGEPGGTAEERVAERLSQRKSRLRVNAFLSGRFVDDLEGVRFGHAAVIVEGNRGSVRGKTAALREAGVFVADRFDDILEGLPT